jgi:hypothetical protein
MSNMALMLALAVTGTAQAGRDLRSFSDTGVRSANRMASAWKRGGNIMSDSMRGMAKAAAMVGGFSAIRSIIADVAEFDKGLSELRQTGQISARVLAGIRKDILGSAREVLQLPEAQLAAYQQMVAAGLDPSLVQANMKALSIAASGSFSDLNDMASTAIDLIQKMNIRPEGMSQALDSMIMGSRLGKFEMKDMARYIPKVASDMQRFGIVGQRGVAQMTAMLQVARMNTALPEEAATNLQNFFGHIVMYSKDMKKHLGINILDYFDFKSGKLKAGKEIEDFFQEIIAKSGGSMMKLEAAGIRDIQAKAFIQAMMQNYREYELIRDKALNDGGGAAKRSFDEVQGDTWAQLKKSEIDRSTALKSEPAAKGAAAASGALSSVTGWAVNHPVKAALAAVSMVAGGYGLVRMAKGFMAGRGGDVGNAISGALGGGGTPLPVFVTNWPGGGASRSIPGGGGPFNPTEWGGSARSAGQATTTVARTVASKIMPFIKTVGALAMAAPLEVAASAAGGYAIGSVIEKKFIKGAIGEALYDLIHGTERKSDLKTELKNDIRIELNIDGSQRVMSATPGMNNRISVMKRGSFFDAMTTTAGMGY